jgi:hypothetical protein
VSVFAMHLPYSIVLADLFSGIGHMALDGSEPID